jgi:hypothetical protein
MVNDPPTAVNHKFLRRAAFTATHAASAEVDPAGLAGAARRPGSAFSPRFFGLSDFVKKSTNYR